VLTDFDQTCQMACGRQAFRQQRLLLLIRAQRDVVPRHVDDQRHPRTGLIGQRRSEHTGRQLVLRRVTSKQRQVPSRGDPGLVIAERMAADDEWLRGATATWKSRRQCDGA
jgi:hypothetical protein